MINKNFDIIIFNYKNIEYEVLINNSALDKMNYDWNSYNFIDKDYLFISIREIKSDKMLNLTTEGFAKDFIVIDFKTNEEIMDWDKILELSKKNKLYEGSKEYLVEDGNWFTLDFVKVSSMEKENEFKEDYDDFLKVNNLEHIDSCSFDYAPKNFEELIALMIHEYNQNFN